MATADEIDKLNILEATKLSMRRAIKKFKISKGTILIDGNFKINFNKNFIEHFIIGGDSKSISIAAASIIAKVYRDKMMSILSKKYSKYEWEKNSGYGTKKHLTSLKYFGPTPYHRKTFQPLKSLLF